MNISQCNPLHLYVNPIQAASGLAAALRLWPLFCPILNFDFFSLCILHIVTTNSKWFIIYRYSILIHQEEVLVSKLKKPGREQLANYWLRKQLWPILAPTLVIHPAVSLNQLMFTSSQVWQNSDSVASLGPMPSLLTLDLPVIIPMGQ